MSWNKTTKRTFISFGIAAVLATVAWCITYTPVDTEEDVSSDVDIIQPLKYKAISIKSIKPEDILPIISQVELWDKDVYKHIEHLRIAEATRIRDMMWTYGAGNHTPEEYQELMNRLNIGMLLENPKWYDNYESIWWKIYEDPSNHAHNERYILNTLINHANFKVVNPKSDWVLPLQNYLNETPNNINIFWCSAYATVNKEQYMLWDNDELKEMDKSKNYLLFVAWSNINQKNWILKNKMYHEDMEADEHWVYWAPSRANGKNDSIIDRHLIITIWTNMRGNIDQTNEIYESSKFPVWFHNDVLFAGREFPYYDMSSWKIVAKQWKYPTSYTNYTNVAIAALCFQMYAEVEDVDQLLYMIRSSTDLRDHIIFEWEDLPLILMNPAGFFNKYLMPADSTVSIKTGETIELKKGYYKWVVFDIPGAEVLIDGEWIVYSKDYDYLIKRQNPMTLKWRLNWDLCKRMGYKSGTFNWKIIVVDDQWNGLNIEKVISVKVNE